jgi:hypothetical protein
MYVSLSSPVLPIFAGIYKLSIKNRELILLLLYLIIGFAVDIISMWFIKNYWINLGLWHIYVLFEYIFIMCIIYHWQETKKTKKLFMTVIYLYILFWVFAKFTFEPFSGVYSITASVCQVILTLSAGYTLFAVIGNRVQPLLSNSRFWVMLSFVFYYTGTLMPTALVGMLFKQPGEAPIPFWSINWILTIFCNILFTIGFLCPQTQQSYSRQSSASR